MRVERTVTKSVATLQKLAELVMRLRDEIRVTESILDKLIKATGMEEAVTKLIEEENKAAEDERKRRSDGSTVYEDSGAGNVTDEPGTTESVPSENPSDNGGNASVDRTEQGSDSGSVVSGDGTSA